MDPPTPLGPNSTVSWLIKFMGKDTYVADVTEYRAPNLILLTTREGPLKPLLTHRFEPIDSGTSYTRQVRIPLAGAFRAVGPIMRLTGAAHWRNARFAENLKSFIEGATTRTRSLRVTGQLRSETASMRRRHLSGSE